VEEVLNPLAEIGVTAQTSDYPALAALYLHQSNNMTGKSIYSRDKTFRELESGVQAASQLIYGNALGGKVYEGDPKHFKVMRKRAVYTIV
jgi:hypothetical protein